MTLPLSSGLLQDVLCGCVCGDDDDDDDDVLTVIGFGLFLPVCLFNHLEAVFPRRPPRTHAEGRGRGDRCCHFQKPCHCTAQHPPTWGGLRETVRGWVRTTATAVENLQL